MDKYKARQIKLELRKVLLSDWDPIGISDFPEASDEYDTYLGNIFHLINIGSTARELAEYLFEVESIQMGITRGSVEQLLPVSQKLISTYAQLLESDAAYR